MPVAIYVDNGNSSSKIPERYIQPLSMDDKILPQLKSFIQAVRSKSVEAVVLDSGVVKKNGFYGKGSEKLIQKLSYSTYHTALHSALTNNKYYLLLVTAF
jgi:type IV secretory pathway TrbF-like protein